MTFFQSGQQRHDITTKCGGRWISTHHQWSCGTRVKEGFDIDLKGSCKGWQLCIPVKIWCIRLLFTYCSRWTVIRSGTAPLVAVAGNVYGGAPAAVHDMAIDWAPHLCGTVGLPGDGRCQGKGKTQLALCPPALIIPPIRPEKGQMLTRLRNGPSFLFIP